MLSNWAGEFHAEKNKFVSLQRTAVYTAPTLFYSSLNMSVSYGNCQLNHAKGQIQVKYLTLIIVFTRI